MGGFWQKVSAFARVPLAVVELVRVPGPRRKRRRLAMPRRKWAVERLEDRCPPSADWLTLLFGGAMLADPADLAAEQIDGMRDRVLSFAAAGGWQAEYDTVGGDSGEWRLDAFIAEPADDAASPPVDSQVDVASNAERAAALRLHFEQLGESLLADFFSSLELQFGWLEQASSGARESSDSGDGSANGDATNSAAGGDDAYAITDDSVPLADGGKDAKAGEGGGDGSGEGGASMMSMPGMATVTIAATGHAHEAGTPGEFTVTRTGSTMASLNVSYMVSGTAGLADYSQPMPPSGSVTIQSGQASAVIPVTPRQDNLVEGSETVVLTLAQGFYVIGSPSQATVNITDDPARVSVTATDPVANETGDDNLEFQFSRTGGNIATPLTVKFARSGTATETQDYHFLPVTPLYEFTIPAYQTSGVQAVDPLPDLLIEGPETVILTILPQAAIYQIANAQAEGVIADEQLEVESVIFRQLDLQDNPEYGRLNPHGASNPDYFAGGDRIIPGSINPHDKTGNNAYNSRNLVRVRADVTDAPENSIVYFRAFDVDDPGNSAMGSVPYDREIDPNDGWEEEPFEPRGYDNRGKMVGPIGVASDPLDSRGFAGVLRPILAPTGQHPEGAPGEWVAESGVAAAPVQGAAGNQFAEVDLAVSFAPGDNFRVVASFLEADLQPAALDDIDDVPTTGADTPELQEVISRGAAVSGQLSVWRELHVEMDLMATSDDLGDWLTGVVISAEAVAGNPLRWRLVLSGFVFPQGDPDIAIDHALEGGTLRFGGLNYTIIDNIDVVGQGQMEVIIEAAVLPVLVDEEVTLFDDDRSPPAGAPNGAPTARIVPSDNARFPNASAVAREAMQLYMQEGVDRETNRFADAYIEPRYDVLADYSDLIPARNHITVADTNDSLVYLGDPEPHRDTHGFESPLFWVAYVTSAYQYEVRQDFDPDQRRADGVLAENEVNLNLGAKSSRGVTGQNLETSFIFFESNYDSFTAHVGLSLAPLPPPNDSDIRGTYSDSVADQVGRTAVHEVGHQFKLEYWSNPDYNIMFINTHAVPDDLFWFIADDVANKLRFHFNAPGT